ncbi:YjcZ family sporulation protein [Priestia megaterium]|uniref:YjcZ family sporulation protein n=1 Tax=Priestia megaterium TaxID=1404 RepID=A0A6H1PC13_PRIMG|nr:YjcZ family sporulation protein [Priestia megaterium]
MIVLFILLVIDGATWC